MELPPKVLSDPYELVSLESVARPGGESGDHWYRYEIMQGSNKIVGYREGDIEVVTEEIDEIVIKLNERRRPRRGRVHLAVGNGPRAASGGR